MDKKSVRDRTFGQWLQHQLDRREWTKAEFARRLGVANGDVSRWVRDERVPSPASIDRIADVLGVDVDLALTMAGHRPPDLHVDPDSATAQLMPLIEKIDWDTDPGRLEGVRMILEGYLEVDRRRAKKT